MRRLWALTVWHPDGVRADDWRQRHTLRVWLPLFDFGIVFLGGLWAAFYGSPILWRLFPAPLIETAGTAMAITGLVCFVGVIFPRLWPLELVGKLGLIFLIGCYAGTVAFFPSNPDANNGFVVFILVGVLFLGFIRVTQLSEDVHDAIATWRNRKAAPGQKDS